MHRFYVEPTAWGGGMLVLSPDAAHHALRVLRLRVGDPAEALDGCGRRARCVVGECRRGRVELLIRVSESEPPPACRIVLFQALPKARRFDLIVEKAVELGAEAVVPLLTERVVARPSEGSAEARAGRWERIAVGAAEQCGAAWLTRVPPPRPLSAALAAEGGLDLLLLASLQPGAAALANVMAARAVRPRSAGLLIGPEGDFTEAETEVALQAGAVPVSLGTRTLRVETAALFGLSVLGYELNRPASVAS
jgi:16S rRNA (uracil1498-N3)-methyltransferase